MEGRSLGRYRITSKLAEGGMGAVYLATHELMGREVVIKVLLPQMSTQKDIVQRFFNEARATGSLNHPGIVAIFDLDYDDDGRAYIVMERLHGETLQQRLRRVQRMSIEQTVEVTRQLASALGAAHGKGVVHRDLKPGNVFLSADPEVPERERVKVLDFGVAKLALQQNSLITNAGAVVGTPAYMAPEQCKDSSTVDHRADLYALGCIMYACLCGQPPFLGGAIEVLAAQLRDVPPPPRTLAPLLPPWLDEVIARLLEKEPGRRLQSCAQLIEVLDRGLRLGSSQQSMSESADRGTQAAMTHGPAQLRQPTHPEPLAERDVPTQPSVTHGATSTTFSMANTAAAVPGRSSGARRRLWLGIGAPALIVFGVGLYFGLTRLGDGASVAILHTTEIVPRAGAAATGTIAPGSELPAGEDLGSAAGDSANGAAEPTPPTSMDTDEAVQRMLDEARAALESKDWATAASKAQDVLQLAPEHAAAREIVAMAGQEQANALLYREFEQALMMRDFDKAKSRLAALPESSIYRERAKAKFAREHTAHKEYLQRVVAQAEAWRDAGKCVDIRALQAAWAEKESELAAIIEQCEQANKKTAPSRGDSKLASASAPAVAAQVSPGTERKPAPSGSAERKPASRTPFDELLTQAQEAAERGFYGKAQKLCREALEIQPKEPRAIDICAVAACQLGNAALAKGYYAMTTGQRQSQIHRFCLSKGIDVAR